MGSTRRFHAIFVLSALLAHAAACGPAARDATSAPSPRAPAAAKTDASPRSDAQPSQGISREEQDRIPPGPPGTVNVTHDGVMHAVEWNGTRDDTITGYAIYRRCPGGEWSKVGLVPLHADDARNRAAYDFRERFDSPCDYAVAAVGADGQPGPKSADVK